MDWPQTTDRSGLHHCSKGSHLTPDCCKTIILFQNDNAPCTMYHVIVIYLVRRKAQVNIFTFFANIWYFSLLQFWIRNILNVLQFRYIQHFLVISSFEKFWKIFDVVKYFVPGGYVQTKNLELNKKKNSIHLWLLDV